ncbi:MAG TPA: Dyp-type peroxidase [Ideonella sp.]|uniref:Dyp-type peroxidase n=1 Tax=Ideonella sp. TaxID=1929293 RepID=UPI002E371A73|nr:Dyp-type peroxidase [Ideonella sp.]HEX5683241.1 Dyp-type peroxidase [Ideonella sp.]
MRAELIVKSKALGGVSDLTLLAPLKKGFVPALDAVTYKTRARRLLKTLSLGRATSHEYALLRPFSDAVERVGKIHSVRVAIVEPEDKILLAVTFDGTWEAYLRVLWQKVGTLLDVIFCNTEDYPSACDHSFDAWASWVRRVQVETDFFYGMPRLTVDDVQYLRQEEQLHRDRPGPQADLAAVRATVRSPEQRAWEMARRLSPSAVAETVRMALQSLSVIHRLASLYLPTKEDGKYLHRAARDLLLEFIRLKDETLLIDDLVKAGRDRFAEQLDWLLRPPAPGRLEAPPPQPGVPASVSKDVQAGILHPLPRNSYGALLMFAFDSGAAMASFIGDLRLARDAGPAPDDGVYCSVSLTVEGLRRAGLSEDELAWYPLEFRAGMEARASVLGDAWHNHPRRWRLPVSRLEPSKRIELSSVELVVQLRSDDPSALDDEKARLLAHPGSLLLAEEPMQRHYEPVPGSADLEQVREHFDFVDGISNPGFDAKDEGDVYDNRIALGEVLLGHPNQADAMPSATWPAARRELMHNGSFLVVRKLRQDVDALKETLHQALDGPLSGHGLTDEAVLAKMMGRGRDGRPLIQPRAGAKPPFSNDFDYANDPDGSRCPFHAHVRRANPRPLADPDVPLPPGGRFPRLVRRGMSYGPRHSAATADEERGLMFMAYNASIAEQFEVVQRWLSGGNSSGGYSGQGDPFLGVAPAGQPRHFRFEHKGEVCSMLLDEAEPAQAAFRQLVRLEWGAYLFTPSISALGLLQARAALADTVRPVWSAERGLRTLETLEAMHASTPEADQIVHWKAALEDPEAQERFACADLWAAIRAHRDGALRTPYGVIVADAGLVKQVLARSGSEFSVSGYRQRMGSSIGEVYLGLDDTGEQRCPYRQQSTVPNDAISAIGEQSAFQAAFDLVNGKLKTMVGFEQALSRGTGREPWELNLNLKELIDPLIEGLCVAWFGVPTAATPEFKGGPARWDWTPVDPPPCPGNFTAPSRFFFQPQPGRTVQEFGKTYGKHLTRAMTQLVTRWRRQSAGQPIAALANAPVASAIFAMTIDGQPASDDLVARTMVGAMMGFIPTLDGALRLVLNEWLRDGEFWALRNRWQMAVAAEKAGDASARELADAAATATRTTLVRAMQLRPMPELVWRTVAQPCQLGPLTLERGEKVVLSIASAMQQALADGSDDVMAMFGGDRSTAPHSHACPGYAAAVGAMLGAVTALLKSTEPMRPSPAPLAVTLGPLPPVPPLPVPPGATTVSTAAPRRARPVTPSEDKAGDTAKGETGSGYAEEETSQRPLLLAEGDSWFDHWSQPGLSNLLTPLRDSHGYEIDEVATAGDTLKAISQPAQLDELAQRMRRLRGRGLTPRAILLSAGGNDIVARAADGRTVLERMLNKKAAGVTQGLDEAKAKHFVGNLRKLLEQVLHRIDRERKEYFPASPPPIVLHGYAYPVPDGRGALGQLGNWLLPAFQRQGWADDPTACQSAMERLIDLLNEMLSSVAAVGANVLYVDLRETLRNEFTDYRQAWANELHPTVEGYAALAAIFHESIDNHVKVSAVAGQSHLLSSS